MPTSAGVQFVHGPTHREYPARCIDFSEGGILMYVPATAPIQVDQPIQLTLPDPDDSPLGRFIRQPVEATVVRVDRKKLLSVGHVAVGVRFRRPGPEGQNPPFFGQK